MKNELKEQLNVFNEQIIDINKTVDELSTKRKDWARENSDKLKKLFPKANCYYEIIDIKTIYSYSKQEQIVNSPNYFDHNPKYDFTGNKFYFKTEDKRKELLKHFDSNLSVDIEVYGDIYNENFEFIVHTWVDIFNLSNEPILRIKNPKTKIYLMIDKNTGYYKIGRSSNPKIRESTLQSEKPTIEMLFNFDGYYSTEKELHVKFKEQRIRGEWFDLRGSDIDYIKTTYLSY